MPTASSISMSRRSPAKRLVWVAKSFLRNKYLPVRPFYRKYPHGGGLSHTIADGLGLVDIQGRIFFNRIPKAANSTVAVKLAELRFGITMPAAKAKCAFASPSQLSSTQLKDFASYFKFTVVRNPYERVLSAYIDKIKGGKKLDHLQRWRPDLASPGFSDFCRYLDQGGLFMNPHWAPQAALMLIPIKEFDFIGRVETLEEDLGSVLSHFGSARSSGFGRHGPAVTRAEQQIDEHYDANCRSIIGRLYAQDFDTFGYTRD